MISASLYIIVCSARNRLRTRLRRLREPRYLLGAVAGAAYLYFSFFSRMRSANRAAERRQRSVPASPAAMQAAVCLRAGTYGRADARGHSRQLADAVRQRPAGFLRSGSSIPVPGAGGAPPSARAPDAAITARDAVRVGVVAAVSPLGGVRRVQVALGMWLVMAITKVYFTGISLSRARLASASARARRVAWMPVGVLIVAMAIVGAGLARAWTANPPAGFRDWLLLVGGDFYDGRSHDSCCGRSSPSPGLCSPNGRDRSSARSPSRRSCSSASPPGCSPATMRFRMRPRRLPRNARPGRRRQRGSASRRERPACISKRQDDRSWRSPGRLRSRHSGWSIVAAWRGSSRSCCR